MNRIDRKFHYLCAQEDQSILEAMKVIERGQERLCLVLNKNDQLVLIVSDGDIRRALIEGHSLSSQVGDIHSRKPVVANESNLNKVVDKLSKRVMLVPIVDDENRVKGIVRLNEPLSQKNIKQRTVAVIGLGYVGLTLAVILAENGFDVIGCDSDKALVATISHKEAPFYEDGLENLLQTYVNDGLKIITNPEDIIAETYIITVGTPIIPKTKKPDIEHIKSAVAVIASQLKLNDLVILRSTVPIGCTRETVIPLLEKMSNLKAGKDFAIAYCQERTAEGRALSELRELPQIVGGFDKNSRQLSMKFFNENTHTVIDVGSLEAAEMCKLLDNTYRDTIFAFSNQMALFAEHKGINLQELVRKVNVGYDRNQIPFPSPGVGGPCLSKDPYILIDNFSSLKLDCELTSAARKINEAAPSLIYERCQKILFRMGKNIKNEKIFIVGFAFKGEPITSDLRESTTVWFLDYLKKKKVQNIFGYDPVVESRKLEKIGVKACDLSAGFKDASVVFIMNNHRSYYNMNLNSLLETMGKPGLLYDGWGLFHSQDIESISGISYAAMGVG